MQQKSKTQRADWSRCCLGLGRTEFLLSTRGQTDLFDFIELHVLQIDLFVDGVSVIVGRLQLVALRLVCQGPIAGMSSA